MPSVTTQSSSFHLGRRFLCAALATATLAGLSGCSGVAPSKTASGAGTGAMTGAVVGGVAAAATGRTSTQQSTQSILAGAAAGTIIGGVIGMVQDAKERSEQDRLAQERAYNQDLSKRRQEEAKRKVEIEEELAVAQGFRISDLELNDAQKKVDDASERLKKLRDEYAAALARKKALDEAQERLLTTEAAIAQMEEQLARLKGEMVDAARVSSGTATAATADAPKSTSGTTPAPTTPPAVPKPTPQ